MTVSELIEKLSNIPGETPVNQWTATGEASVDIIYIHQEREKVVSVVIGGDYV